MQHPCVTPGLFPPPLRGRAREGGEACRRVVNSRAPHPPTPPRHKGAHARLRRPMGDGRALSTWRASSRLDVLVLRPALAIVDGLLQELVRIVAPELAD